MSSKRILIIDDEENIRRVTRLALEAAGYEVGEADDGEKGLELFGDGSGWDAVLLDQRMPGMDGLETLRRIKGRAPGAHVIMVTAYASIELAVEAMKLGSSDFVRKPMTPDIVRDAVAAALAKPSSPVPAAGVKELEAPPRALIEHVTMNGFSYVDAPESGGLATARAERAPLPREEPAWVGEGGRRRDRPGGRRLRRAYDAPQTPVVKLVLDGASQQPAQHLPLERRETPRW